MHSNRRVYEIVEGPEKTPIQLGFGSSAVVRLARQQSTSKLVAIKLVTAIIYLGLRERRHEINRAPTQARPP